jgi:hypothetical protein
MKNIKEILETIVASPELHKKWLETLSHLENRGAHKIMGFQPQKHAKLFLLQHAAEEARHAFFFKRQIKKLYKEANKNSKFIGGSFLHRYLDLLDMSIARLLKKKGLSETKIRESCYYLTSYTIEVRAKDLYHAYEKVLKEAKSAMTLHVLLKEEEHHLKEMEEAINSNLALRPFKDDCLAIEKRLYQRFLLSFEKELSLWEKSLCA